MDFLSGLCLLDCANYTLYMQASWCTHTHTTVAVPTSLTEHRDHSPIHDDTIICAFCDPLHVYLRAHLQYTPHIWSM